MKSFFALALVLISVSSSLVLADEAPCTTQEMLYRGELALEPDLVLAPQNIRYKVLNPEGRETIVLVHGLGGSMHTWWDVAKDLAESENYRVVLYDQRGHGDTMRKGENYSSAMMATDLKGLLDHLGIKKARLLGHSMGGRTVARFAHLYPEMTSAVIVEDMHMMGRRTLLPDNISYSRKLAYLRDHPFSSYWEAAQAAFDVLGIEEDSEQFERLELSESVRDGKYHFFGAKPQVPLYSSQGLQEDLTQALASIKVPMLFLAAEQEPVLFGKGVDHLQATKPDAQIEVIPDTHHGMHDSNFRGYMTSVKRFLNSVR